MRAAAYEGSDYGFKRLMTSLPPRAACKPTIAFVFHLDREVEKVNSFFLYKRSELERRLRILSEKSRRLNPNTTTTATITTAATAAGSLSKSSRLDLSVVTSPKGSSATPAASATTSLVPPSPFISDPEADAECLQAMLQTKEMLSKLTWFATMNRRAAEKILKK
jgi:hypothetical protein